MTRKDLENMIKDMEQNGNHSPAEMRIIRGAIESYTQRCLSQYRYYDYFMIPTGKKYGDALEALIRKSFDGFVQPENDTSYDALTSLGEKVEIKSLRACSKGQAQIFLKEETVPSSKFSTSSYQQTKPSCCDWFIFHILYGDGSRLFLIPSSMISKHPGMNCAEPGKIPLSIQHRNHDSEGQVNLGQVLKFANTFEIDNYKLESKYDFEEMKKTIQSRLDEISWKLRSVQ